MTYGQMGLIDGKTMKKNNVYKPKFVKPKKKKTVEKQTPLV